MKIKEFLADEYFVLPKTQTPKADCKQFIFKTLDKFLEKLGHLEASHFEDVSEFHISQIHERQTRLVKRLKDALDSSYDGRPAKAYQAIEDGLINDLKNFSEVLNIREIPIDTNFYRIRIHKENYPLPNDSFFHIPFNLRGKVKTQRFSIPGFPSLYLGNSIYVCWEELKRPNINDFQAVRLKSTSPIKIIDLSPPLADATPQQLYRYLMTWPLVLACSVKVRDHEDAFKPEYIIPQLLLQWVRERQEVHGIAYQTTNIDYKTSLSQGAFTNFVLPVKENKIRGLCEILKAKFEITNVISNQLSQLASGSGNFIYTQEEIDRLNPNIQFIEFIKGKQSKYGYSVLGNLERQLNSMYPERILNQEPNELPY